MTTTLQYAPAPTELTLRMATACAAAHFGTEALQVHGAAVEDSARTVVVFEVLGDDPRGWKVLGDSIAVHVADDGTATILPDGHEC